MSTAAFAFVCVPPAPAPIAKPRPRPELAFYRKYTEAIVRRYVRVAEAPGRTPCLLGREVFSGAVSSCKVASFDDAVLFCVDFEKSFAKLDARDRELVNQITVQQYSQGETASLLGMSLRDTVRKYAAALDRLTFHLLKSGLLQPFVEA